jgi:hypothetical protein
MHSRIHIPYDKRDLETAYEDICSPVSLRISENDNIANKWRIQLKKKESVYISDRDLEEVKRECADVHGREEYWGVLHRDDLYLCEFSYQ